MSAPQDDTTRRGILQAGLAAVGGIAGASAARAAGAMRLAQDKIAPAQVQYQTTPKDGHQCDQCVNWVAPNACKIVSGTISPQGWCLAFAPKQG